MCVSHRAGHRLKLPGCTGLCCGGCRRERCLENTGRLRSRAGRGGRALEQPAAVGSQSLWRAVPRALRGALRCFFFPLCPAHRTAERRAAISGAPRPLPGCREWWRDSGCGTGDRLGPTPAPPLFFLACLSRPSPFQKRVWVNGVALRVEENGGNKGSEFAER